MTGSEVAVRTLADHVGRWAARNPERPALVSGEGALSWRELDAAVDALADHLQARGLQPGDRVAIVLGNGFPFALAYLAVLRAGFVAVPVNPGLTPSEVRPLLTGIRLVVAAPDSAALGVAGSIDVLLVGRAEWLAVLLNTASPVLADPADPAVLLYTAGSTGRPKAVGLTHRNLLSNIDMLLALDEPPAMVADDVALVVLPMFHVYGLNAVFGLALAAGATCVILDRFDPAECLEVVAREGVTVVAGAPPMFWAWSQLPAARESLAGVRLFNCGGAPLAPDAAAVFRAACGGDIWEGYGMTETSPVITTSLVLGRPRPGWVGASLPGLELRFSEDTESTDPGELAVRGPSVFSGYWIDEGGLLVGPVGGPDDDGWFATGDIGYTDDDGDLRLVDRRRELILVSGFSVYPREIEVVAESYPDIAEAAVIGIPDERTGEGVRAYVVLRPDATLDEDDLREHFRSHLARFKCPIEIVPCDALPRSATGRLAKGRLREVYGT